MPTNQEFFQAADPLFQRYNRGDYAGALEIAEELAVRYPEQAIHTYLWRICLTSRLKRIDEALRLFAEGLDAGYWWSERRAAQGSRSGTVAGIAQIRTAGGRQPCPANGCPGRRSTGNPGLHTGILRFSFPIHCSLPYMDAATTSKTITLHIGNTPANWAGW